MVYLIMHDKDFNRLKDRPGAKDVIIEDRLTYYSGSKLNSSVPCRPFAGVRKDADLHIAHCHSEVTSRVVEAVLNSDFEWSADIT